MDIKGDKNGFDYEAFRQETIAKMMAGEKELTGKDGLLAPLLKDLLDAALSGEMQAHVERNRPNRRNGSTTKQVKTGHGPVSVEMPRDRDGSFDPKLIGKRQTTLGEGLDNRILSLYSKGMSYQDIQEHLEDLYGLDISSGQLSAITDKILPLVEQWRSRPLEPVYAFVWLDAVHFKVRQDGKVISKAAYNILAVDLQGRKDLLGIYIGDAESARFWLSTLTDLQNRGVKDLLICSIDNLSGFGDAIETVFPNVDVQLCLVHQVRASLRYVVSKDQKAVVADLKPIYQSANLSGAEQKLTDFADKWGQRYPLVVESWKRNWLRLTRFFEYPAAIRKVVYTTNTVEGFHRQIRCVTKSKGAFSSETALLKLLYLTTQRILESWKMPLQNWGSTLQQLAILFEDRVRNYTTI
ncbi:transposase-like protein [Spirosoma sp. LMG 31448]|uniref:Mutator family transposase n=2 Tax=Spirosoma utsteinense TaxID=2585773 RepID=A0ABR6WF71_9BACT|nr:transposase-like protein [Spirosoma utsteinense]MBC3795143.1 transposase-like protein [Spirosoma utsteinense]